MSEIKYPDIYFTKEYQDLFAPTEFGGEPCQFTYAGIDYRFYKRPIPDTPYFDIVSPYGYSGPVLVEKADEINQLNPTAQADIKLVLSYNFLVGFKEYCTQNNIIAEFARLHPFCNTMRNTQIIPALFGVRNICTYEHDIFYVDLTQSESEIWSGFDKGCKSSIKKAQRLGLETVMNKQFNFINLYSETMQRVGAAPGYIFKPEFYTNLLKIADVISIKGGAAEACLLKYGDYCHYFLSASKGDNSGATNLLLWDAIRWAKYQGCKIFNLGGGLKAGDSLESFKRSFSKLLMPFYTYRKIHNTEVYNKLCEAKGINPDSKGYFPAYRREN
jgi:serine/alanine adding enzyme